MALTNEQIKQRKIGGSSASKIMGVSKYSTRYEQFLYDTGQIEQEDLSDKVDIIVGNKIESPLRKVLNKRGFKIETDDTLLEHPDFEWWSGYIDGYDGNDPETVDELKSSINWRMDKDFGADGTDDVPIDYLYQVNHYMLHPRFKRARLHVVFLTKEEKEMIVLLDLQEDDLIKLCEKKEIRTYYLEPDFLLQEEYIKEAEYYWKCVQTKTPPTLISAKEVTQRYLESSDESIQATDEIMRLDARYADIKKKIKTLESESDIIKDKITVHMGEKSKLIYGDKVLHTYKTQNTAGYDIEACKKEHDLNYYHNALDLKAVKRDFPEYVKRTRVFR